MSEEENQRPIIVSRSEKVQHHESVVSAKPPRISLSLMQAVDISNSYLKKILGQKFLDDHFRILGIDKRPDIPQIWDVIYEFNSNGKTIELNVAINKEIGEIDEDFSRMIKGVQEIFLMEVDAKRIATEKNLADIYSCELDLDFSSKRIVWRIWGWGYEEDISHCESCRKAKDLLKKGFLIDAESGRILKTIYNFLADQKIEESDEKEDRFSDFIPIEDIEQEKVKSKVRSSSVVMDDPDFAHEIYINEDQTIDVYSHNISSETKKLYHKIFVYYPNGTSAWGEGDHWDINPDWWLHTEWSVPNSGKGIGIFDFRCEIWEDIPWWFDSKHDEKSDYYWAIFHRPSGVGSNYYCNDTWHHPSNSIISGTALHEAGGTTSPRDAAIALMQYVHDLVSYDRNFGDRSTDLSVLSSRRGDCNDFADLYIGLARSINIPTRIVAGYIFNYYSGTSSTICGAYCNAAMIEEGHAWSESYYNGAFHHVDPTWNENENPRCYINSDPEIYSMHASAYTSCSDNYTEGCRWYYDLECCLNGYVDVTTTTDGGYDSPYACPSNVDGDGYCDNLDTDRDNDGVPNDADSDPCTPSPPELYVYPTSHDFGTMAQGQVDTWTFYIENAAGGTLSWNVSESLSWISVSPSSGGTTIETDNVTVTIDTSGLALGQHYSGNISVSSNGGNELVYVEVTVSDEVDSPPIVLITSPQNGDTVSGSIEIHATASDDVGVTKIEFYIDNGLIGTDTSGPYIRVWDTTTYSNGTHVIKTVAYDTRGQTDYDEVTVNTQNEISNGPPTACFTRDPPNPNVGQIVSFDASCSFDPDGDPLNYSWDFDDGYTAIGISPTHSFSSAGTFYVILTVTDSKGASDIYTGIIFVKSSQPNVVIRDISFQFSSPSPEVGDPMSIVVTVENLRTADEYITLRLYDGYPSEESCIGDASFRVPALQEFSRAELWVPMEGGTHDIYATIEETGELYYESVGIGTGKILPVPYSYQGGTGWCWAHSLSVILRYYGRQVHPWDMAETWNKGRGEGLSNLDIQSNWFKNYLLNLGLQIKGPEIVRFTSFQTYKEKIDDGTPIWVLSTDNSHWIVVLGYCEHVNGNQYLFIHDSSGVITEEKWKLGKKVCAKVDFGTFYQELLFIDGFCYWIVNQNGHAPEPHPPKGSIFMEDSSDLYDPRWCSLGIHYENEYYCGCLIQNNGLMYWGEQEATLNDYFGLALGTSNQWGTKKKYEIEYEIKNSSGTSIYLDCFEIERNALSYHRGVDSIPLSEIVEEDGLYELWIRLWKPSANHAIDQPCDEIGPIKFRVATNRTCERRMRVFENVTIACVDGGSWEVELLADFWAYLHKYNIGEINEYWSFSFYVDPGIWRNLPFPENGEDGHCYFHDTGKIHPLEFRVDVYDDSEPGSLLRSYDWMSTDTDEDGVFGDPSEYGGWMRNICDDYTWNPHENQYAYLRFIVTFRIEQPPDYNQHFSPWWKESDPINVKLPVSQKVTLDCPADLHVYDFQGNHVGALYSESGDVTGIEVGIPGATYNGNEEEPEIITLPLDTEYFVCVVGLEEGEYTLGVTRVNPDGSIFKKQVEHAIHPGQSHWYSSDLVLLRRYEGYNEQRMYNKMMQARAAYCIKEAESLKEQVHHLLQETTEKGLDVSEIQSLIEKADELLANAREQYLSGNYIAANNLALEALNLYLQAMEILKSLLG